MTIDIKYKLTPVAFSELNGRGMINYKHHNHRKKKCKNSHTLVGKTADVWRVGSSAFAQTFSWVYFSLFFKPGDFFNTTWAI